MRPGAISLIFTALPNAGITSLLVGKMSGKNRPIIWRVNCLTGFIFVGGNRIEKN